MSEAFGRLILKAPDKIAKQLVGCDESVGFNAISSILEAERINADDSGISSYAMFAVDDEVSLQNGYVVIDIFGSEWITFAQVLTEQGKNIEIYANLQAEYGEEVYAARGQNEEPYFKTLDFESGDYEDPGTVIAEWETKLPDELPKSILVGTG